MAYVARRLRGVVSPVPATVRNSLEILDEIFQVELFGKNWRDF